MEPAASIITALGGIQAVARATGVQRIAVWKWMQPRERGGTGGTIPQRHHLLLLDLARAKRKPISPADFLPVRETAA